MSPRTKMLLVVLAGTVVWVLAEGDGTQPEVERRDRRAGTARELDAGQADLGMASGSNHPVQGDLEFDGLRSDGLRKAHKAEFGAFAGKQWLDVLSFSEDDCTS